VVVIPKITPLTGDGGAVPSYLGWPGAPAEILAKLTPGFGQLPLVTAIIPFG
jgi:hypothetical protein